MYLTRIYISRHEALRNRLNDAYDWHQALWRAFAARDGQNRDFLTRIDQQATKVLALTLSSEPPTPSAWGLWETRRVAPTFLQHDRYVFSLRANPTTKRVVRDEAGERRKNGRRTRICSVLELMAWLQRKGHDAGFEVDPGATVAPPVDQVCWKGATRLVHASVDYNGTLTVRDRQGFVAAYRGGIGPAKAFGFGLLLLRPIADGRIAR